MQIYIYSEMLIKPSEKLPVPWFYAKGKKMSQTIAGFLNSAPPGDGQHFPKSFLCVSVCVCARAQALKKKKKTPVDRKKTEEVTFTSFSCESVCVHAALHREPPDMEEIEQ